MMHAYIYSVLIFQEYGKQNARLEWCRMVRAGTEIHWDAISRFYFPPDPDDPTEDRARRPYMSSLDKTVLQSLGEGTGVINGNNKVAPNATRAPVQGVANPTYRVESEIKYAPAAVKPAPPSYENPDEESSRARPEGRRKKKSRSQPREDDANENRQPTSEL